METSEFIEAAKRASEDEYSDPVGNYRLTNQEYDDLITLANWAISQLLTP